MSEASGQVQLRPASSTRGLFTCRCFTVGAYLDKSVCGVMCVINTGVSVTRIHKCGFVSPVN